MSTILELTNYEQSLILNAIIKSMIEGEGDKDNLATLYRKVAGLEKVSA